MKEGEDLGKLSLYLSLLQEGGRRPAASVQKAFIECCWSCWSSQRLAVIFSPLFIFLALCAIAFVVRSTVTQSFTSGHSCFAVTVLY